MKELISSLILLIGLFFVLCFVDWYSRGGYETPSHYFKNLINQTLKKD